MPWNKVEDIAPPKDRVIEVTSGAAWVYDDTYFNKDNRYRPDKTSRYWSYQGNVELVLWYDALALGDQKGAFMSTRGGLMPEFKFWREYENPLAGLEGYLTDTTPPHAINETFDGDARLRLYPDIEAKIAKDIAWAQNVISRDVADNRPPSPSVERSLKLAIDRAHQATLDKAAAYDPYDIPENVRGTPKSG